jgi:hypothetical protein
MSEDATFVRAFFEIMSGPRRGGKIEVHFNPATLQYAITNTLQQQGESVQQYVSQSTGKLTMDLVFDTTGDGQDVRNHTTRIAKLMEPDDRIPPVVRFDWGAYAFQGMVESYRETIDFFSPNGVPLRAGINLTLASQEEVFAGGSERRTGVGGSLRPDPVELNLPPEMAGKTRGSASDVAMRMGAPGESRAIAEANGLESLRFAGAGPLTVEPPRGAARPDAQPQPRELAGPVTDRGAGFSLGGQARLRGSSSLRTDVGQKASLLPRVRFGGG